MELTGVQARGGHRKLHDRNRGLAKAVRRDSALKGRVRMRRSFETVVRDNR